MVYLAMATTSCLSASRKRFILYGRMSKIEEKNDTAAYRADPAGETEVLHHDLKARL